HDTMISNYNFLISGLDTLNSRIIAYEKLHQSQDLKLFKELLVSTRNFMENYSSKASDISSYQSGDLAKIDFAKELAVAFENSNRYLSNRKNIIEEAQKRDKVRWEQIFAKERRNRGIKNLIVGGLTLLVGTGAIIATGGSGTPLVIAFAGKVFGTGTVAYSVSNLTEAGQDTIYGSLGDNETRTINPIRDTIFLGNDKLYHGTGQFFTIGSSILIPIGKTNSIIKGSCQFLAGSAGAWVGGKVGYYGLKKLGFSEENAKIGQFIVSMLGAYAGSKIVSGFTLNKTFKLDESFLKLNTKVEQIKLRAGIWLEDKFERGIEIDGLRGNNLGHNFPVIDRLENRVITSIKSRDLSAESYLTGKRLEYTIKSDINKLIKFKEATWNGNKISPEKYSYKCLEVVVPNVTLNESQINCINNAIEYGKLNNIIVKIIVGGN
ncbi:endonuclease toxin domain-containing protein, partial [Parvimonas micra]